MSFPISLKHTHSHRQTLSDTHTDTQPLTNTHNAQIDKHILESAHASNTNVYTRILQKTRESVDIYKNSTHAGGTRKNTSNKSIATTYTNVSLLLLSVINGKLERQSANN